MANQLSFSITARNAASTAMNALQRQVNSLKNGLTSLGNNTSSTSAYLNSLNRNVSSSNTVFGSLGRTVRNTIGIFGGFKIVNSILNLFTNNLSRAIQRADTMDLFEQKMTMITNDANNAKSALEALTTATKGTPYALDMAAKGVQNFVLRGMTTKDATESVKIWMDAVSAYGKGKNDQFESVMDAIAKMRTKGTVEMRYLNRLFAAGINPVQMYATATGQTSEAVQEALSNKDLSAKDFLDVVETAMREGTNGVLQIQGKAKELATTWAATTQNMGIAIARGILKFVEGVDKIANLFNENGLKGIVKGFGESTENALTAVGGSIGTTVGVLQKAYQQVRNENQRTFTAIEQRIGFNQKYMSDNFAEAGQNFKSGFYDVIGGYLPEIILKFDMVRDVWSSVAEKFSAGIRKISEPLGRLAGTYLGETITGFEDLAYVIGNWLTINLPPFFEKLEKALNWLINHKDGVVSAVKTMIKTFLGLGMLQTLQGIIVGFNDKLKALNSTLAFFTMGKIQIPTLENLATGTGGAGIFSKMFNKKNNAPAVPNIPKGTNIGYYLQDATDMSQLAKNIGLAPQKKGFGTWVGDSFRNTRDSFRKTRQKTTDVAKKAGKRVADTRLGVGVYNTYQGMKEKASDIKSRIFKPKATMGNYEIIDDGLPKGIKSSNAKGNNGLLQRIASSLPIPSKKNSVGTNVALTGTEEAAQKSGMLTKVMDKLKGVFIAVGGAIKTAVAWITGFIATTSGVATAVVLATAAVGALVAGLGVLNPGNAVSDGINKFFETFGEWCTTFATNAPIVIQSFVDGLRKNLPTLVSQGVNLLLSLVNGIMTGIPKLLTVGASLLFSLISGILQVLPDLVYQGFSAIGQFVAGIISNLPNVLAAGWELLTTLLKGILFNLPLLVASGIKLIGSLITGIGSMIGQVWEAIKNLIVDSVTYVWNHPQEIWDAFTGLCNELWNALLSGLYAAADTFNSGWILDALGAQRPEVAEGGAETAQGAIDGATDRLNTASIDVGALTDQLKSEQAQAEAAQAGQDLGSQMTQGVTDELTAQQAEAGQVGVDTGTSYVDGITQGVTESSEGVDSALSTVGSEGMAQLTVNFNGEQVQQAAGGLIDALTATINERSLEVAMSMAGMAHNAMITLAASFQALPEDVPNAISVALTDVVSTVGMKVQEIANSVKNNLLFAKNEADNATLMLSQAIMNNFNAATISVNASIQAMADGVRQGYENLRISVIEKLGAIESAQTVFSTEHMATFQSNMLTYEGYIESDYQSFVDNLKGKMDALVRYSGQSGKDMMTEMASGIATNMQLVVDKASELVQKLKKTFEEGLGIHSPSRYMFYIGQMLLAGLMGGLSPDKVQSFIDGVVGDMQGAFDNGKYQAPNADEAVNFLSDQGTLDLIGRVSKVDTKDMNPQQIAYPLIGTMGTISSPFGRRSSPGGIGSTNHAGMDIAAGTGTPIASALAGTVTTAGWYGGYGNAVVVDSGNGLSIVYGHMSQVLSSVGQVVQKGQQIGLVGSTGNSTGPHLHFEMRNNGDPFDPAPYLGGAAVSGVGNTLAALLQMAYNKKHGIITGSNVMYNPSDGAAQWSSVVLQALAMLGQPASLLNYVLYAIERESSGNPNAINLSDSNAVAGHPSQGLLQTIPSTFAAYRNPNLANSLTDPLANIYAGLNYMIQRYGGIEQVVVPRMNSPRGWYGYSVGTRYVPFDMPAIVHQGEAIIPASQNPYSNSGGDYLGDIISNAMNRKSGINGMEIDTKSLNSGLTNNNNTNNTSLNNTFNITNSSDVDSDRSISEMEQMLHRMLQDGKRVGVPR